MRFARVLNTSACVAVRSETPLNSSFPAAFLERVARRDP
jgi:hypothetical protein